MGGGVSARMTYWTGAWGSSQESISREVDLLRSLGGGRQPVVSISRAQGSAIHIADRVVQFSPRFFWLMRALAPIVERFGEVTHVVGGLNSWHLLRVVGRRPVVMTVALPGPPVNRAIWSHVAVFVAESEQMVGELREHGVPADRIRLIYPGVDLHVFRPGPPTAQRFRLLFPSSPPGPGECAARGMSLLADVARRCPKIDVVLPWRAWGDREATRQAFTRLALPNNVHIESASQDEMPAVYRSCHAVACLDESGFGPSCPDSVVRGLACGVPAIVSESCGIADLVAHAGAGLAVRPTPEDVAAAVRDIHATRGTFARAARSLAERHFDLRSFLAAYLDVYREVAAAAADVSVSALSSRRRWTGLGLHS